MKSFLLVSLILISLCGCDKGGGSRGVPQPYRGTTSETLPAYIQDPTNPTRVIPVGTPATTHGVQIPGPYLRGMRRRDEDIMDEIGLPDEE